MNAFGGMFAAAAAASYQDPYHRMAALQDQSLHHHHHHHHQYKVPRIYFKIPRVLPHKEQKEKFETDDFFKKLIRESEVCLVCFGLKPRYQTDFGPVNRSGNRSLSIVFCQPIGA